MKAPSYRIVLAPLILLLFRFNLCAFEPLPRSVSPSRQFIIYGGDARFRAAISALAEKTKSNLLTVLKRRDNWKIAIVVNLQSRAANLPEIPDANVRFSQSETGLKLQLDFAISPNLNPATIEHELTRAIVLEMIYRNQTGITSGDVYVDPPRWLVDGLLELAPNRDHTSISTVVALPDRVISLEAFLLQSPESLDSVAKEFYRAYSFVLVQMLIESPNGRNRIERYVDNLAIASNDPVSDLRAAFPEVRDFERSWRSKIAQVRSSEKGLLTFSQTEERLNRLLGNFARFDELASIKPTPVQRLALRKLTEDLMLLATHANPVLQPVIQDYQKIAGELALGKNRAVAAQLGELKTLRRNLAVRMGEIDDYLNWIEAVKPETASGMFDDYLKADGDPGRAPRRKDPLSLYLDAVEMEF